MQKPLKILLADDSAIVHKTVADYLHDLGHNVERVHNGCAALNAIEARNYDLALIDICISNTDKIHLLTEIRETRPDLPVVIIAGCEDMDIVIQAMRNGAADFLTKPIKLLELDAVMEKSIRNRELMIKRLQAEKALQESEKRHHLLVENLADVVWITDTNLKSTYVNPAVSKMLGYSVEEAIKLGWEAVFPPESLESVRKILTERPNEETENRKNSPMVHVEKIVLLHKDSSTLYVEAKFTSLHDSNGKPLGIMAIFTKAERAIGGGR